MNCFPCFQNKQESSSEEEKHNDLPIAQPKDFTPPAPPPVNNSAQNPLDDNRNAAETENNTVKSFTFRELATATKNFRQETLLGEGGFGKVFKGTIQGQTVAVRQLDRNGAHNKDFVFEISTLSLLRHPNLVKMVGYCADGEQRLLVYEYLPSGSLENHLFDLPAGQKPLDWNTRMKIALGVAEGLVYLHEKANPPVIYRDMKSSNVLLNESNNPKLSDYGLAKIMQSGQKMHVSVMAGYNGYCAPEYERNGELTMKSDVYSFGVVLLELITGRRALDTSLPPDQQSLVSWAQPIFRDPSKFPDMADPLLRKGFPVTSLNQAVGVAAMCLQEEPSARPLISDISAALSFLAMAPPEAPIPDRLVPILSRVSTSRQGGSNSSVHKQDDTSESEDEEQDMEPNEDEQDDNCSSDYEYGSSDCSDYEEEETRRIASQKERKADNSRCKSTKSKKLGSNSKRRSKKKSVKIVSPPSSRSSRRSSSASSRDGFSLRCDSSFPEESVPSNSGQDINQQSHDSDNNSSSSDEEENWNNGSSSQNRSFTSNGRETFNSRSSSVGSEDEEDENY